MRQPRFPSVLSGGPRCQQMVFYARMAASSGMHTSIDPVQISVVKAHLVFR